MSSSSSSDSDSDSDSSHDCEQDGSYAYKGETLDQVEPESASAPASPPSPPENQSETTPTAPASPRPGTSGLKKKKKILPPIDPATFFVKGCHICPKKIRAANIRHILKNPPPFKLNLGSQSDIPGFVKFAPDDPPIFRIPEKLRIKIYKYISVQERTQTLQLVCRRVRKEIRLRVGMRCLLHENTRNGETFFRDVIVESVVVGKYTLPYMSPKGLMIHPRNVKELFFVAPISIPHFDAFLLRCRRIETLFILDHVFDKLAPPTPTRKEKCALEWRVHQTMLQYPASLRRLRTMKIDLAGPPKRSIMSLHTMLLILLPKFLRRLSVRVGGGLNMGQTTNVHFMVLSFIQQFHHLTHLLVSTEQDVVYEWRESEYLGFQRDYLCALGEARQFRELILTETFVNFRTWGFIFVRQKKLEVFQVLHLLELSIPQAVIQKNYRTLRKVAINVILWVTPKQHCPLDLSMFHKCLSLEELYICTGAPLSPGVSDLTNFQKLPPSLKALLLKDCTFQANDLVKIVKTLPNLQTIGILSNCMWKNFGVKTGTIRKFLRLRNLKELFVSHYQVMDGKGKAFCNKKKFRAEMEKLGGTVHGKPEMVHIHGDEPRWFPDESGEYACSLVTAWGQ